MKKLNLKNQSLFEMIDDSYEEIWDTCCDHGYLGMALLEANTASKVHFVDIVPSIMTALQSKLTKFPKDQYELHCLDAGKISLNDKRNLVCITGVGGEVAIEIIKGLKGDPDLLLSPHYYLYEVRKHLKQLGYKSVTERIIFEGIYGRELFLVSKNKGESLDPVGSSLFDLANDQHMNYLMRISEHRRRKGETEVAELYKKLIFRN